MKKLVVCNLKMNMLKTDIDNYLKGLEDYDLDNVVICPTSIYVPYFLNKKLNVGVQNISRYEKGSYTGQVSAMQVASLGIKYSLIGHAETNNDDYEINEKIKLCLDNNIKPIICIGEETKSNIEDTLKCLEQKMGVILNNINNEVIIAYEPKWMIGSNNDISTDSLQVIINFIKNYLISHNINGIIIYGGGITESNIKSVLSISNIDGVLIGNASLEVSKLLKIIEVTV